MAKMSFVKELFYAQSSLLKSKQLVKLIFTDTEHALEGRETFGNSVCF